MNDFGSDFMKKHELLVPVGDKECLKQAVFNGADAVYLSGKTFGARKFAVNFTNEEIIEAIRFCHLYGVKIYITMNTLVKDNEVEDFINQVRFLHQSGVDAIIVQDFGMICLIRKIFPNLEIHASTQANISSEEVCQLYYDLGVKRVVFARELSLDEINSIKVPIEKEAFIHGALCIAYSGGCLFSSMLGGRSGNRGECAGCCRMPYTLYRNNQVITKKSYLLSTKELNTSAHINQLLESDIYSFKIEGRMKNHVYVGFITRFYRNLIDGKIIDRKERERQLKIIFNREFTKGRILNAKDEELMNQKKPNHIGLEIGKVLKTTDKKIKIKLNKNAKLHQYDAIRFYNSKKGFIINYLYDEKMNLTNSINNIGYVDNKVKLDTNDIIYKTQDYLLEKEISNIPPKKIDITFRVFAKKNLHLVIKLSDGIDTIEKKGNIVEPAKNCPMTSNDINKNLNRLKDTPFTIKKIYIDMDSDIFIPVKELNELRRNLINDLIIERQNRTKTTFFEKKFCHKKENNNNPFIPKISCTVMNESQLKTCLDLSIPKIYVKSKALYEKYKKYNQIYYCIPRYQCYLKKELQKNNLVSDYGYYINKKVTGNYPLNITNSYTAFFLKKQGYESVCISPELTKEETLNLISTYHRLFGKYSFEILVYGLIENMVIKGNILNLDSKSNTYYLKDIKSNIFPVYYKNKQTHILNYEKRKWYLKPSNSNITLRLDFYDENSNEIASIVKKYQ